ncbi:MAG: hypothetical protein WBM44_00810 [Waterburya sp.]
MTEAKTLKVISLTPPVVLVNQTEQTVSEDKTEEVILAPFLLDENQAIEDISELVSTVYQKFSEACGKHNLNWEAELELGLEFGVKFAARLKLSPNKTQD